IGTAETYDVIVEPTAAHYQIEAESIDRSGFAIGSLHQATDSSKTPAPAQLPTPRPRALLTMEDMDMLSSMICHMTHTAVRPHNLQQIRLNMMIMPSTTCMQVIVPCPEPISLISRLRAGPICLHLQGTKPCNIKTSKP